MKNFCSFIGSLLLIIVLAALTVTNKNDDPEYKYLSHTSSSNIIGKNEISGNFDKTSADHSSWYNDAIRKIQKDEYNISYSDELQDYQSPNRANNIRFVYHKDGFTAVTRSNKIPQFDVTESTINEKEQTFKEIEEWSVKLSVRNFEFQKNEELIVKGNKAHIENDDIRINYENSEKGMRQDFIIKHKPENTEELRLSLKADTKLDLAADPEIVVFKDRNGNEMMKYSSLKCWDANDKELIAYFEQKENSKTFDIVVNDADAVYPVTIDPLTNTPDWSKEVDQNIALFGYGVSSAGDVNGDSYDDVIIGAYGYDNGQTNEGKAFLYYGSATGLSDTGWTGECDQPACQYGLSVAYAGDVNDDGYDDVIVGAPGFAGAAGDDEGRIYIYHGTSAGLSYTADTTIEGTQMSARFGGNVATAGDVDGNGYSDVIIGEPQYDNGNTDEGRAYVYLGSANGIITTPHWMKESDQFDARMGRSVSSAGDINGDGYSDVIVSAYKYANGQTSEGKAFVYNGSDTGLSDIPSWTAEGNLNGAGFGYGVSYAGDVNGDNYDDVIVGAYLYSINSETRGKVFVYHGSASGLSPSANWTAESTQQGSQFGASVSDAGDVNGDGYDDVLVGAPGYDNPTQANVGWAFEFHGSSSGLRTAGVCITESGQTNALLGSIVSDAGDINGDGFDDVLIGVPEYTNGQSDEGRAYVFYGYQPGLNINLSALIQGFYNSASNSMIGDTVTIYLRDALSPYEVIDSDKEYLDTSGNASFNFPNTMACMNYYIQIVHRNSIETWSYSSMSNVTSYDFTTSASQAFGDNQIQVDASPVLFAIYGGDVNQDGVVDGTDGSIWDNDAYNFLTGYVITDVTGDEVVDGSDGVIIDNNSYNFVTKSTP